MSALAPFDLLYDASPGEPLPLSPELLRVYGRLSMPLLGEHSYVFGNVVETVDGVVALGRGGTTGGREISGGNPHDLMLIGLLRAVSDAIVIGAGTLRSLPRYRWTPGAPYRVFAASFEALRKTMGKTTSPLIVVVSASGDVDLALPTFHTGSPWLVVTTRRGAARLPSHDPEGRVAIAGEGDEIPAAAILRSIEETIGVGRVLVEGGPRLFASFFTADALSDLFLTLSPQLAGRDEPNERLALIAGAALAPDRPLWGHLFSVRRDGSHLFLRYGFGPDAVIGRR